MKQKKLLLGKNVTLYLEGSWELSGVISDISENSIVIKNDLGSYIIFRDKVCGIHIPESLKKNDNKKNYLKETMDLENSFPSNRMAYSESSMHLPLDLLSKEDRKELEDAIDKNDLSVYFGSLKKEDKDE